MAEHLTDDELQAVLGRALAVSDPVPPAMVDVAKGLLAWRGIDAALARITSDSAMEDLAGVRAATVARTVLFTVGEVEVELTVASATRTTSGAVELTLDGQLIPDLEGVAVTIRHRGGESRVVSDDIGAFTAGGIPQGPVSLIVDFPDGPVTTESVIL